MTKEKFSLTAFLKNNIIPILLLTSLFSSVSYIYALSDWLVFTVMTIFSFFYFFAIFIGEEYLRHINKGWLSTVMIIVLGLVLLFISEPLIETKPMDTMRWFLEPRNFSETYTGNILAVILLFGFVIGSALFYFTRIRFRSIYVFLICMCPFSLFAKSFTDIPVIFTVVIFTLFFLLIILNQTDKLIFIGNNKYAAVGAFIVFVSLVTAFFPKLEYAPYREEFDELITGVNIGAAKAAADYNLFSESSNSAGEAGDEVLYRIYGDNPRLIKRQCFNYYDSSTGLWNYNGGSETGYNYYSDYISWENPSGLAEELGIEMNTNEKYSIISYMSGKLLALYTAENTTDIYFPYSSLLNAGIIHVYRNSYDEFFIPSDNSLYEEYAMKWRDFDIDVEFMLNYTDEAAEKIGKPYSEAYLRTKNEMKRYMESVMTEEVRRESYKSVKDYERVKELVNSITAGCDNDYEKAFAIERYFMSSDFVYDDEFSPNDTSVENFLFRTKRGACADYATAMTLMCREAGLYSRYVEGFLVQNKESDGVYTVSASDGHAYVQVWLNGYGWTDFNPTSSNIDDGYADPTFIIIGVIMLIIAVGGASFFMLRPVISEKRFVRKASALRGREQLLILYPRMSAVVHNELRIKNNVLTVGEIKEAVTEHYMLDISELADDYEASAYGDVNCGNKNYIDVYFGLRQKIKQKKKEERKKK